MNWKPTRQNCFPSLTFRFHFCEENLNGNYTPYIKNRYLENKALITRDKNAEWEYKTAWCYKFVYIWCSESQTNALFKHRKSQPWQHRPMMHHLNIAGHNKIPIVVSIHLPVISVAWLPKRPFLIHFIFLPNFLFYE